MKKNMTMISRLLAFSFLVLMGVTQAMAYERTLPQTSTDANPVYYLIMDLERGFYLRFTGAGEAVIDDQCTQLTDNHLWYFVASGNGYKIAPKQLNGQYLLNSGTYNSNYNATGDTWLIETHASGDGYMVYTSTTTMLGVVNYNNYWRLDRYGTSDYARIGRESGAIPSRAGKFIFIPYDPVEANAQKTGVYLIKSRSTGQYLAQAAGDNNLNVTGRVTTNCAWSIINTSGTIVNISSYFHEGLDPLRIKGSNDLTLMPAHDAADGYYIIGGAQQHTLYANTNREAATWGNGLTIDNDWELIPYSTVDADDVLSTEEDIAMGRFFRIENYRIKHDIGANGTNVAEDGGWLEDVDHRADPSMKDMPGDRVDIYCVTPDMSHAAALWEIELAIAKNSDGNDQATGVLGTHSHNIYRIRNANTNKYIGEVNADRNGSSYLPVVRNIKSEKARYSAGFWFEPLGEGQYRIAMYDRTSTTTDNTVGYLVAETSASLPYCTGLKIVSTPPTANSEGAWYLHLAEEIEVVMHTIGNASWASAYFPFDVVPTPGMEVYTGEWTDDHSGIILTDLNDVPAGNGMIIKGQANQDRHSFAIAEATSSSQYFANSPFSGIVESECYPIDQNNRYGDTQIAFWGANNAVDSTCVNYGWGYYYVLSGNTYDHNESNVGMYHPNGDYLIANKAYVKLENPMGAPAGYLFVSRQNSSAAVEEVVIEQEATEEVIYDLMGRRVVNPTRGIYIVNGKKVFIQ